MAHNVHTVIRIHLLFYSFVHSSVPPSVCSPQRSTDRRTEKQIDRCTNSVQLGQVITAVLFLVLFGVFAVYLMHQLQCVITTFTNYITNFVTLQHKNIQCKHPFTLLFFSICMWQFYVVK